MASSYTTNLRLVLPVQGELAGTWGDTVNAGLTNLVDTAVAGTAAVTMTDADYTLTTASGAADEARSMFIALSGTLTAARNVICPASSKLYFVTNSTTGGFAITFKTSAGAGISVPNGKSLALYCDGTNVIDAFSAANLSAANITGGSITGITDLAIADGGTGASTAAQALVNLGERTAATGSIITPTGTTAQRDGTPAAGYLRFNSTLSQFEGYNGTSWSSVGGGATGGGADQVFIENGQVVTTDYTIPTGKNAMSTGPITIDSGITVTVPDDSVWAII